MYVTRRHVLGTLGAAALALASALAVLGIARVAHASPRSSDDAAQFLAQTVRLIGENRYAEVWATLHPLHKHVAPRAEYVECEGLTPIPGEVRSVEVLGVEDEQVYVPGSTAPLEGKAAAVRITIAGAGRSVVVEDTVHAVESGGRWTWILPAERFAAYRADSCVGYPSDAPPWRPDD